ncbi:hypothetical protein [Fodinibius sp. Rm-B-1B1-1]|uniref:hypothetical protein n=1 Tax=Fodinibius alkaliphilus TaxID=3140241 RepID=UPI003159BC19
MKSLMSHTLQNQLKVFWLVLSLMLVGSCDQGISPKDLPKAANEKLAFAVAAAMGNPDVRESVHSAMDASPYNEHKLVFGEFLSQPEGAALKKAVAKNLGGEDVLNGLLDELPSMDFYLPYETHRETWEHANNNLMAICVLDVDAKGGTAYRPDGSKKILSSREEVKIAKVAALFSLHPEERKISREQSADSAEKMIAERIVRNGGVIQSNDWKTGINEIQNWTTDGSFGGDCEFYFKTTGNFEGTKESKIYHVPPLAVYLEKKGQIKIDGFEHSIRIYPEPASSQDYLTVTTMEADGGFGPGGDDNYGTFVAKGEGTYDTSKESGHIDGKPKARITIVTGE